MGADCKSAGNAYAGSNPARPRNKRFVSNLLQKRRSSSLFDPVKERSCLFLIGFAETEGAGFAETDGDSRRCRLCRSQRLSPKVKREEVFSLLITEGVGFAEVEGE